jgi:GntR family transcriptional regulator
MPVQPDYFRIADAIVSDIEDGRYDSGDKLPSIDELCQMYRVSASTIRLVFVRLEALGIIDRHQGKGVFVTDPKTWLRRP